MCVYVCVYTCHVHEWCLSLWFLSVLLVAGQIPWVANSSSHLDCVTVGKAWVQQLAALIWVSAFVWNFSVNAHTKNARWAAERSLNAPFASGCLTHFVPQTRISRFDQDVTSACKQESLVLDQYFHFCVPSVGVTLLILFSYLSRSLADGWGTTVDFTTSFLHSSGFSAFHSMIFHSRPVHSLTLSSHRFLCLPLRLPPWTVPCRIVLASPDDRVTCPYHFSLRLFTEVRRSSYGLMAFPVLAFTSSLVMWSLYEIPRSLQKHLIPNACILLSMSAVMVHVSHAYKNMAPGSNYL